MTGAVRFAFATALLALAVGGCDNSGDRAGESEPSSVTGSFVGTVPGSDSYVAIVAGPKGDALAHVTDGASGVDWLDGTVTGRTAALSNDGGATVDARFTESAVTGSFTRPGFQTLTFTARPARAPAGFYRAQESFADGLYAAGWVVLPDGSIRGSVRRYETPLARGEVDASTYQPGDPTFTVPGGVLRPARVKPADLPFPS
ncbi:MAG TPA: hypothetical protein VKB11_01465 [Acidimicrobiia bacterium]|jgi:hypothetical protein|nr:hypothetical protein [Acidimicrobiia bacterium]